MLLILFINYFKKSVVLLIHFFLIITVCIYMLYKFNFDTLLKLNFKINQLSYIQLNLILNNSYIKLYYYFKTMSFNFLFDNEYIKQQIINKKSMTILNLNFIENIKEYVLNSIDTIYLFKNVYSWDQLYVSYYLNTLFKSFLIIILLLIKNFFKIENRNKIKIKNKKLFFI